MTKPRKPRTPPPEAALLTKESIKALRLSRGETQAEFWVPIGYPQTSGSRYESGIYEINDVVRRMVSMHYRVGVWK